MASFSKNRQPSFLQSLLAPSKSKNKSKSKSSLSSADKVPGLILVPNAISASDERELLQYVDDDTGVRWTTRRTRQTKNYGPYYYYHERDTEEGRFRITDGNVHYTPLPSFLPDVIIPMLRRAVPHTLDEFNPNQLHVALYDVKNDGKIHMHNDNKMGELGPFIVGICLLNDCEMTFVNPKQKDKHKVVVKLPRYCVYVMSGESHHTWRHGILAGQTKGQWRVSFTLREVRKLSVEQGEGVKVIKSNHQPTKERIELTKLKDSMRQARQQQQQQQQQSETENENKTNTNVVVNSSNSNSNSNDISNSSRVKQSTASSTAIKLVDLLKN